MSYKPDEKDWMAYLYGELDDADKAKFEQYMSTHPEARLQLQKYQDLRSLLSMAEDKEVIAPPIFIDDNLSHEPVRRHSIWDAPYFRTITTVAASLIVILLAAKFTGTRVTVSPNEFRLSFGDTPAEPLEKSAGAPQLSSAEVQQMINASLAQNNYVVQEGLEETQKKLEASIRNTLALNSGRMDEVVRQASSASQEQIRQYVEGIRTENMEQVKEYFQLTSTEQKKYIENLLVDFSKYLQQQRNNDLQLVQTRMNSLEQNTDMFKHETEQILSSIITTVGNPNTGEIKN